MTIKLLELLITPTRFMNEDLFYLSFQIYPNFMKKHA